MLTGRFDHSCALLTNDTVLVSGGWNGYSSILKTSEIFSISTGTWQSGPSLPKAMHDAQMINVDDTVYHIGGMVDDGAISDIYRLDKDSTSSFHWSLVGHLKKAKYGFGVAAIKLSPKTCNGWINE